ATARTMSQRVRSRSQLDSNPEVSGKAGAVQSRGNPIAFRQGEGRKVAGPGRLETRGRSHPARGTTARDSRIGCCQQPRKPTKRCFTVATRTRGRCSESGYG